MRAVLGRLGLMPLAKPLTSKEGHDILARDRYRCQYCGLDGMSNFENSLVMTVDFVVPRARKGGKKPVTISSSPDIATLQSEPQCRPTIARS